MEPPRSSGIDVESASIDVESSSLNKESSLLSDVNGTYPFDVDCAQGIPRSSGKSVGDDIPSVMEPPCSSGIDVESASIDVESSSLNKESFLLSDVNGTYPFDAECAQRIPRSSGKGVGDVLPVMLNILNFIHPQMHYIVTKSISKELNLLPRPRKLPYSLYVRSNLFKDGVFLEFDSVFLAVVKDVA
jgi:hypothetical protein